MRMGHQIRQHSLHKLQMKNLDKQNLLIYFVFQSALSLLRGVFNRQKLSS